MIQNMNLPKEYVPFKTLKICSNKAVDYKVPIGAKNYAPLLVGKGDLPLVWIAVNNPENSEDWKYLVSKNKSLHPQLKVIINQSEKSVTIKAGDDILIHVVILTEDEAAISEIDLRPIGFNIVGDEKSLKIGGNSIVDGTFVNVGTVIGLG